MLARGLANGRPNTSDRIEQWPRLLLASKPKDEEAKRRYQGRLQEIAAKRGAPVSALPPVTTWADAIELDQGRM